MSKQMNVKFIRESTFGNYKNKSDKLERVKKETKRISDKWFDENIKPKILEYYIPALDKFQKEILSAERSITILKDCNNTYYDNPKTQDKVYCVEILENSDGSITINQCVTTSISASSYEDLYFIHDETFTFFDDVEEYISKNFAPCTINLINCYVNIAHYAYNSSTDKLLKTPFMKYKNEKEIPSLDIKVSFDSLDPVFKFFNRFTDIIPEIATLGLQHCENIKSLKSSVIPKFKVGRVFVWGCANLRSYDGWKDWMDDLDPVIIYNINGILDNTNSQQEYCFYPDFDVDLPAFEEASHGKIPKRYLEYLRELKIQERERMHSRDYDNPEHKDRIEESYITFLEYHLQTDKVRQYEHDPYTKYMFQ